MSIRAFCPRCKRRESMEVTSTGNLLCPRCGDARGPLGPKGRQRTDFCSDCGAKRGTVRWSDGYAQCHSCFRARINGRRMLRDPHPSSISPSVPTAKEIAPPSGVGRVREIMERLNARDAVKLRRRLEYERSFP